MSDPTTGAEALRHALALAERYGLAVLPLHRQLEPGVCSCRKAGGCPTPGKHPRIRWADRPAEPTARSELERWWRAWPDSRVGVLLGDRLCCFDVDMHGALDGLEDLRDLEATFGALPATWRALSPSGGLHVYFRLDGEVSSTTHKLRDGVQLRAGRHIMACPPSDGRQWEISPGDAPLADLPSWVPQLATAAAADGTAGGWLPLPAKLPKDKRHESYVRAARSMARIGLPLEAILAALEITDRLFGDPPKNDRDELAEIALWATKAQIEADAADHQATFTDRWSAHA